MGGEKLVNKNGECRMELKALIVYYSESGNTEKAAEAIRRGLERENIKPVVKKVSETPFEGLQDYDLILIGSGVFHWTPGKRMRNWASDVLDYRPIGYELGMKIPGKNGVVFITHSGPHTAVNEAIPAAKYLGCFLEHIGFDVRAEWYIPSEFHGIRFPPCQNACPINQDVPWYIALIAKGQLEDAIKIIRKENPLPSVCGRVCTRPCEDKCEANILRNLQMWGHPPIAIRALKRFASDYRFNMGRDILPPYKVTKNEKIGIIGSGPAGLTAAHYLSLMGYKVTIFEALPVAGGMLAVGIPSYRLPKEVLQRDIDVIIKAGVDIRLNTQVGKDLTVNDLQKGGYKAILIATGTHESIKLDVPGQALEGVVDGLSFLRNINLGKKAKIGGKVVVIGGGNVAVDSARSARRLGSKDVTIVYRRSRAEMPASEEEVSDAEEEGVEIKYLAAPTNIVGINGKVQGLECVRMKVGAPDESGRRQPIPIKDSEFRVECDIVIPAIGQSADLSFVSGDSEIRSMDNGALIADPETFETGRGGIFAAGDVVSGPATVIEAMAAGKKVAKAIDCYLRGEKYKREDKTFTPATHVEPIVISTEERERLWPKTERLPVAMRTENFREVELGFTPKMATTEAMRCLRCDLIASRHEELRLRGQMGDTRGRPNEQDLAELEDKAAKLARWLLREAQYAQN